MASVSWGGSRSRRPLCTIIPPDSSFTRAVSCGLNPRGSHRQHSKQKSGPICQVPGDLLRSVRWCFYVSERKSPAGQQGGLIHEVCAS